MADGKPWMVVPSIAALLISIVIVTLKFSGEPPIDTDILHALPLAEHDTVVAEAVTQATAAAGQQVTVVVRADDAALRERAARELTARLQATGYFTPRFEQGADIAKWLFANRNELLCPDDQRLLATGGGEAVGRDAVALVLIPGAPASGAVIAQDPFLLGYRLLRCLVPPSPATDTTATIISGRLDTSPYRIAVQDEFDQAITDWRREWSNKGVTLARSGAVFYAHAGAIRARQEISLIGGIGTVAIILLFWVIFQRMRAPALAVATVGAGILAGLATCLTVFETISVMTLVFGAALVGIADDYALHYMMTAFAVEPNIKTTRLRLIFRPLLTGMVTSVCGFLALALFTSPVLTQIAVFASAGLIASWAFAIGVLPLLDGGPRQAGGAATLFGRIAGALLAPRLSATSLGIGALVIVAIMLAGFSQLTIVDDVRALQRPPADLRQEEEQVKRLTGFQPHVQFLLTRGDSLESAKRAEEDALAWIEAHDGQARETLFLATTRFDPSERNRSQARDLLAARLFGPYLTDQARRLGIDPRAVGERNTQVDPSAAYPEALAALRGATADKQYLIVPLTAVESDWISARAKELPADVSVVDPVARYAAVLRGHRQLSLQAFGVAVAVCAVVVAVVYRRWSALKIIIPPAVAAVVACCALALVGFPFSFFSGIALLVVLGTGIDFAVFQYEYRDHTEHWMLTTISLEAVTTVISMGLLGLSQTMPVASFGLTVGVGVILSLMLSCIVRPLRRAAEIKNRGSGNIDVL